MGSNGKRPYFPNNWEYIAAAPAEVFNSLPFEFVEWRVHGWHIPEDHLCIRVHNTKTGKIKERSYKQAKQPMLSSKRQCKTLTMRSQLQTMKKSPTQSKLISEDEDLEKAEMLCQEIIHSSMSWFN